MHMPTVSFAGLGFLALYLAGKMHLFDRRGHVVRFYGIIRRMYTNINCGNTLS